MKPTVYRWASLFLCYTLTLLLAGALGYLFYKFPKPAIDIAGQNRSLIITVISAFVLGPIWVGYNRLSVFDKLPDLPPSLQTSATTFARKIRAQLIRPTIWMAIMIVGMIILLSVGHELPRANIIFAGAMPLFLLYMLYRLRRAISLISIIDKSIEEAHAKTQKEVARKKLIDALKQGRSLSPLAEDEHLAKYRRVINPS